jgi:hypothetical protein
VVALRSDGLELKWSTQAAEPGVLALRRGLCAGVRPLVCRVWVASLACGVAPTMLGCYSDVCAGAALWCCGCCVFWAWAAASDRAASACHLVPPASVTASVAGDVWERVTERAGPLEALKNVSPGISTHDQDSSSCRSQAHTLSHPPHPTAPNTPRGHSLATTGGQSVSTLALWHPC